MRHGNEHSHSLLFTFSLHSSVLVPNFIDTFVPVHWYLRSCPLIPSFLFVDTFLLVPKFFCTLFPVLTSFISLALTLLILPSLFVDTFDLVPKFFGTLFPVLHSLILPSLFVDTFIPVPTFIDTFNFWTILLHPTIHSVFPRLLSLSHLFRQVGFPDQIFRERKRERKREKERKKEREKETHSSFRWVCIPHTYSLHLLISYSKK